MVPLALAFRGLARAVAGVWRDPETKALPFVAAALVLTGTLFYWRFEDWTVVESLYFSIVTLTTVGYGDLAPTTAGTPDLHDLLHPHRHRCVRRPAGLGRSAIHRAEGRRPFGARASERPSAPRPGQLIRKAFGSYDSAVDTASRHFDG
jgi:hypothetical protein